MRAEQKPRTTVIEALWGWEGEEKEKLFGPC